MEEFVLPPRAHALLIYSMAHTKIAVIGTHSTGKTTLIKELSRQLAATSHRVHVLPEFARLCPYPIDEGTSFEAQEWIQSQQIAEEKKYENSNSILICDRSTLDNFAYMHRACSADHDLTDIETRAAAHMKSYSGIFKTQKLPMAAKADGTRSTQSPTYETFRADIDALIHSLLQKHQVPFFLLPPTPAYAAHMSCILHSLRIRQPHLHF